MSAQLGTSADEAAIRKIVDARNAAYNSHDAKGLAATYAPDADLVTGTGRLVSGRAAIEQNYVESFAGVDQNAIVKTESTKLRFLTADTAILDLEGVTTGRTDGTIKTHATWVCVRRKGQWMVVAIRATRIQ
jgi:uncharacterized protein (TIGR02246 family)